MSMKDIFKEIEVSMKKGRLHELLYHYLADDSLDYDISKEPIYILKKAFFESLGGNNSLEYICNHSMFHKTRNCLATEIAATALIDENIKTIHKFIEGAIGSSLGCSWEEGRLLQRSYEEVDGTGFKVSLGHTHPVYVYKNADDCICGAIPSCTHFKSKDIVREWIKDPIIRKYIFDSKIYKQFGGDYIETYARSKISQKISRFSWIVSPAIGQLGVFEVKSKGRIIYHPWRLID